MRQKKLYYHYDREADVMYFYFERQGKAKTVGLNEDFLLRLDSVTEEVAGLTIIGFSRHFSFLQGKVPDDGEVETRTVLKTLLGGLTNVENCMAIGTYRAKVFDGINDVRFSDSCEQDQMVHGNEILGNITTDSPNKECPRDSRHRVEPHQWATTARRGPTSTERTATTTRGGMKESPVSRLPLY